TGGEVEQNSMWVEVKRAQNLMTAEMWKELFEGEGIPTRILPVSGEPIGQESATYRILVPEDKEHIISEVVRKL
ncbi:unnamed protein product, partial [marine sediment metagenome]